MHFFPTDPEADPDYVLALELLQKFQSKERQLRQESSLPETSA
jgi:hypothetical protein